MPAQGYENISIVIDAVNNASKVLNQVQKDLGTFVNATESAGKQSQNFFKKFESAFGDLASAGGKLSIGLTAPIALLGKTMVDQVGNIEQYKVAFDTMLGSAEEGSKVLKKVSDFAAKTPFDLPQVTQASKQLLAYGFTADELIPTLKSLGDVASGVGAPIGDIAYLFGTLRAQGRAFLVDIRQFQNRGIPIVQELAKQFGVSEAAIYDMVSAGKIGFKEVEKAFSSLTGEGGQFFNLMENQSQTLKGVLSNLRDNFVRVSLSILGISTEAETFGQIIEGGAFDRLKSFFEGLLEATNKFTTAFSALPEGVKNLIVQFTVLAAAIGPLIFGIGKIGGALIALNPATLVVVAALTALVVAIGFTKKAFDDLINSTNKVSDQALKKYNDKLKETTRIQQDEFAKQVASIDQSMRDQLTTFQQGGEALTEEQQQQVDTIIAQADFQKAELVKIKVREKAELVKQQVAIARSIGGVYDAQNNQILQGSKAFWFNVVEGFKVGGKIVIAVFKGVGRGLIAVSGSIIVGIIRGFQDMWNTLKDGFQALIDGDFKAFLSAGKDLMSFKPLTTGLKAAVSTAGDALSEIGGDFVGEIKGAFEKYDINRGLKFDFADEFSKEFDSVKTDAEETGKVLKQSLGGDGGGGGGGAGKGADTLKDKLKDLGKELEHLGVFAVETGGKMFGSFDTVEKGLDIVSDAIKDTEKSHEEALTTIQNLTIRVGNALAENLTVPNDISQNYDDVKTSLAEIEKNINSIIEKQQKWVEDAKKGLAEYAQKIDEINKKFDELAQKTTETAGGDLASNFIESTKKLKDVNQEILDLQAQLSQQQGDQVQKTQEQITKLQEQKTTLEASIQSFNELKNSATDYATQLEKIREKLASTTDVATKEKLTQDELTILGKQQIASEELQNIESALADQRAKERLTETDFIAFKLGKELQAIETKRQAELKAAEEINSIQKLIAEGKASTIDVEALKEQGFSEDALAFAEKARLELETYQTNLMTQLELLKQEKEEEKQVYADTTQYLISQQQLLESFTTLSLDRLIAKFQQMAAAAREAEAAARRASNAKSGGAGFATGGFTGAGPKNQVAGLVHKGEWVAPKWMVQAMRPMFGQLESLRSKGFVSGGFTSPQQVTNNTPITMNNQIYEQLDFMVAAKGLAFELGKT